MENTEKQPLSFGVHYMLDAYGADKTSLQDVNALTTILRDLPKKMGMHPICDPVIVEVGPNNKKDPGGVSGFVMIAESHISFHTFPNRAFVTIDVYTCNDELDTEKLRHQFNEYFKFTDFEEHIVRRGTRYPVIDIQ